VNGVPPPQDENGHGTHTVGTVGAVGNNGIGVTGVCHTVRLMPLKFLNQLGCGATSDGVEALRYATANGAFLSSNSWGGCGYSMAVLDAIQEANAAGIGFVVAAGNSGISNDVYLDYPSSYEVANLISVAASDHNDDLAWFSNFGAGRVHLAAGGDQIMSTGLDSSYPAFLIVRIA
jgi:subtilisin family serine protease